MSVDTKKSSRAVMIVGMLCAALACVTACSSETTEEQEPRDESVNVEVEDDTVKQSSGWAYIQQKSCTPNTCNTTKYPWALYCSCQGAKTCGCFWN